MLVKDSPDGPVIDHSRTPSDGSTVAAPTLEEVQVALVIALQALQMDHQALQMDHQDLRRRMEMMESIQATIDNTWIWFRDSVHCFLWFLVLVSFNGRGPNYYN
ncbi:hypothetical protein B0H10DRAFT_2015099 [Mycena sp. CBHHK59/15]|nr:hypothetical protein B0H10DRAFT_2015099 [Mycena sp. CBHHK59/15]